MPKSKTKPRKALTKSTKTPVVKKAKTATQGKLQTLTLDPTKKKILHVGCGVAKKDKLPKQFRGDEWQEIRLDIDPKVFPDIVADMTDMSAVPNGSMDAVFSSHTLEHLYAHLIPKAFKEFNRVLKSEGLVVVATPDIQAVAAYIADGMVEEKLYESPAGPIAPIDMLYGWRKALAQGNTFMAHHSGSSAATLAKRLLEAGFYNVVINRHWVELWGFGNKRAEGNVKASHARIVNIKLQGPAGQKLPHWYERKLRMEENPEVKTDELSVEPQIWKPLLLKN